MSVATKDGAWISATKTTRIYCDRCGVILTSRWPMNDREEDKAIADHAREKHGGVSR